MIPKYVFLVLIMALSNTLLLYNLFGTSNMNLPGATDPLTSSTRHAAEKCQNQMGTLQVKAEALQAKVEALLQEMKQSISEEKYARHVKDVQTISGRTATGNSFSPVQIAKRKVSLKYSCPEIYKGSTFGYPFFLKGFVREKCINRLKPSESTTLILDRPQVTNQQLHVMVHYAANVFHSVIVVMEEKSNHNFRVTRHHDKVTILRKKDKIHIGVFLREAVNYVKTPLTLVSPFSSQFDNSTDIERLLHVLELSNGDIVGGSVKKETGEWDRGCYQFSLKLYTLKYRKGYTNSKYECLYCHHLVSPFLTYTKQLESIPFDSVLPSSVYMDYFLQMQMNKKTIFSCPDVMFYTKTPVHTETEMVPFTEKWDIKRIIDAQDKVLWFGCRRKGASCRRGLHKPAPPCCRANLADTIKFIQEQCNQNNITCELQEGTLLGAVKFNHILPWEKDADITVLSADFNRFVDLQQVFQEKGYGMNVDAHPHCCVEGVMSGGTMQINAKGWLIEIYGQHKLTTKDNATRTKVPFAGGWVYAPENPGLYLRNRYGQEIYRHAEHWMTTHKSSGWDAYEAGKFNKCKTPGRHTCLDQFQADGNLQFEGLL